MNIEISLTAFMPNITMLLFTTGNPTSKWSNYYASTA
jgi:hypothetical protein